VRVVRPGTLAKAIRHADGAFTFDRTTRAAAIAFVLLVAAVFMPMLKTPRAAYDYLVVFDITQSMNVVDYELDGAPTSRLTFAREAVRRTLSKLPCGSRIGWGVFAEYRTLVLLAPIEVCENYNDLLSSLDRIDGRMRWGNASEISKGVFWAIRGARDVGGRPKVLFLTDGQEAPPVEGEGLAMFDDLKRGDIGGWLMGVGGYSPRPIPRTDADGRPMGYWHADEVVQRDPNSAGRPTAATHEQLSEVREPYLRKLARQVGFEYQHLSTIDSVREAMLTPRFAETRRAPTDFAWVVAAVALLALLIGHWPTRRTFGITR
jgi:mxaL protein